jgi:DNA-binding transcriptional MerR regulator
MFTIVAMQIDDDNLTVSDVARACGVSPDTVRYYERKGAIPAAARRPNHYRSYPRAAVARVQTVRRAIALGFTIEELARIFKKRSLGKAPCRDVRALAVRKLADLDARLREMNALRDTLAATIRQWDARLEQTGEGEPAHLLESLTERFHS